MENVSSGLLEFQMAHLVYWRSTAPVRCELGHSGVKRLVEGGAVEAAAQSLRRVREVDHAEARLHVRGSWRRVFKIQGAGLRVKAWVHTR